MSRGRRRTSTQSAAAASPGITRRLLTASAAPPRSPITAARRHPGRSQYRRAASTAPAVSASAIPSEVRGPVVQRTEPLRATRIAPRSAAPGAARRRPTSRTSTLSTTPAATAAARGESMVRNVRRSPTQAIGRKSGPCEEKTCRNGSPPWRMAITDIANWPSSNPSDCGAPNAGMRTTSATAPTRTTSRVARGTVLTPRSVPARRGPGGSRDRSGAGSRPPPAGREAARSGRTGPAR